MPSLQALRGSTDQLKIPYGEETVLITWSPGGITFGMFEEMMELGALTRGGAGADARDGLRKLRERLAGSYRIDPRTKDYLRDDQGAYRTDVEALTPGAPPALILDWDITDGDEPGAPKVPIHPGYLREFPGAFAMAVFGAMAESVQSGEASGSSADGAAVGELPGPRRDGPGSFEQPGTTA
jgi:hypothetical protein